jgi:23S rRNA (cytidine1920-2'-O)/16S rRNA (cytidine1409-2'-O)-methyltransferase
MVPRIKKRLDILLVERELFESRNLAQAAIMEGRVLVNDVKIEKAGQQVDPDCVIRILGDDPKYVSRGGFKLEAALNHFQINVKEKICLDVGASTGGFTDCLLQHGAKKVVAIDVGKGQMHNKLRQDDRVEIRDGVNARMLKKDDFICRFDIITMDVSFISQKLILPALIKHLGVDSVVVALIKPQFEVGRENVGKGGIVTDDVARQEVVLNLVGFYKAQGFDVLGTIKSPITGSDGNIEFLIAAQKV